MAAELAATGDAFTTLNPQILLMLEGHLNEDPEPKLGVRRNSSLLAAFNDARGATHRDRATGRYLSEEEAAHASSGLGTIGYLAIIDQIGSCFGIAGQKPEGTNGFRRGLELFSDLDSATADALYGLRRGLAHGYSLVHRSYRFGLVSDPYAPVVTLAAVECNRDFEAERDRSTLTVVNLRGVGDLAEDMLERVRSALDAGRLTFAAGMTGQKFDAQYGFYFGP